MKINREHSRVLHDPKVELWEQPGGNLQFTYFHVPDTTSDDAVRKEFLKVGRRWLDNMAKDGWVAVEHSIACLGPYVLPDYDQLDMKTFYIGARFHRRRPQLITIEDAEVLQSVEPVKRPGREFLRFLESIAKLPAVLLERQAQVARDLKKRAEEEAKLRREIDEINRRMAQRQ